MKLHIDGVVFTGLPATGKTTLARRLHVQASATTIGEAATSLAAKGVDVSPPTTLVTLARIAALQVWRLRDAANAVSDRTIYDSLAYLDAHPLRLSVRGRVLRFLVAMIARRIEFGAVYYFVVPLGERGAAVHRTETSETLARLDASFRDVLHEVGVTYVVVEDIDAVEAQLQDLFAV